MAMTVGVLLRREMLVVIEMVPIVDPRNGTECAEDEQVVEQVIAFAAREQPAMKPIVSDDEEGIIPRADHRERQGHGPPMRPGRDSRPSAEDPEPAPHRVGHHPRRAERAERPHLLRGEQRSAIRVVRIEALGPRARRKWRLGRDPAGELMRHLVLPQWYTSMDEDASCTVTPFRASSRASEPPKFGIRGARAACPRS